MIQIRRASLLEGARTATGIAVVIDVFRAFTTTAFCVAAGAREIVLVEDPEEALAMKAKAPSLFVTGEVGGRPPAGFDTGNSPSLIERLDLAGRRVVQCTSAGTKGVAAAAATAREVVLASFVIASATSRYVASRGDEITLVAMGERARYARTKTRSAPCIWKHSSGAERLPLRAGSTPSGSLNVAGRTGSRDATPNSPSRWTASTSRSRSTARTACSWPVRCGSPRVRATPVVLGPCRYRSGRPPAEQLIAGRCVDEASSGRFAHQTSLG